MPNRLGSEASPYLLQHAAQSGGLVSVGPGGVRSARKSDDKPIFLSIGYSTCHWCHVMEHESFEDAATAELMNREFVSIKVDREERPDVDRVYMTFVQATTGSRRLADERVADARPAAVLRRHLFPAVLAVGPSRVSRRAAGNRARVETGSGQSAGVGRAYCRTARHDRAERHTRAFRLPTPDSRLPTRGGPGRDVSAIRRRPSTAAAGALAMRPNFRVRPSCCFCCGSTRDRATNRRATWCCKRSAPWRWAGCATTSAAGFIATRWTATGASRISRKCSTTRRN